MRGEGRRVRSDGIGSTLEINHFSRGSLERVEVGRQAGRERARKGRAGSDRGRLVRLRRVEDAEIVRTGNALIVIRCVGDDDFIRTGL